MQGLQRVARGVVVGNVDFEALFHVDDAATFGSTLTVFGESTLNDSLHVNSGADIAGTLTVDSLSVTDVINGQVSSLGNHTADDLAQGSTNLYMTPAERDLLEAMAHAIDSLSCTRMKHQGYVYKLILIDDQCWFAENLRSDAYANGEEIAGDLNAEDWEDANSNSEGAQAVYDNDDANLTLYGRLYNWYAVDDSRGLCPNGWHVPSSTEWEALIEFLGGEFEAGGAMRSSASDTPSWDGSSSSGFSGLPGGERDELGDYDGVGEKADWWRSTPHGNNNALLYSDWGQVTQGTTDQGDGKSLRCLRD